eukprot:5026440-Pyramimonas_sp.AAC.1
MSQTPNSLQVRLPSRHVASEAPNWLQDRPRERHEGYRRAPRRAQDRSESVPRKLQEQIALAPEGRR